MLDLCQLCLFIFKSFLNNALIWIFNGLCRIFSFVNAVLFLNSGGFELY